MAAVEQPLLQKLHSYPPTIESKVDESQINTSSSSHTSKYRKNQQNKKNNDDEDVNIGPHFLQTPWTFWYCKKQNKQSNFETTLVSLGTCNTVEEFWRYYSHLKRPNELSSNSNLHLFRGAIVPMWENFPTGGTWVLRMKKGCALLARMWEELLIACIGEAFEEPDVLGVVLSIRPKEDALHVWNANHHLKYAIGEKLKSVMCLLSNCPMEYRTNRYNMEKRVVPPVGKGVENGEEHQAEQLVISEKL